MDPTQKPTGEGSERAQDTAGSPIMSPKKGTDPEFQAFLHPDITHIADSLEDIADCIPTQACHEDEVADDFRHDFVPYCG